MQVDIQRIDKSLPLPMYETAGSVGFDILCRQDVVIPARSIARIPSNVIVKVPEGYLLMMSLRSSTPKKKSLLIPHGVGIIDNDFCGDGDEILTQVYNFSDSEVTVKRGEKIAQGVFLKTERAQWNEVEIEEKTRGGFGSTD